MSEQNNSDYENEIQDFHNDKVKVADWWKGRDLDWVLQDIVASVDLGNGYEPQISIATGAGVVSGQVISRADYLLRLADQMYPAAADGSEGHEKTKWLDFTKPKSGAENHPPQYIHLKNAKIFTGGHSIPSDTGVLWRGKLTAVIGFSYSGLESK